MIIDIKQKNKELFEANFEIISNDNVLGSINVKGKLGSMEVSLNGIYNNIPFKLEYISSLLHKEKEKKYRPYQVIVSENIVGEIYQLEKKTGLFSKDCYIELNYNGKFYKKYGIKLDGESKNPIYLNEIQVAQINKDSTVYNDLHNYKLYVKDNNYSLIAILFSCYMYINVGFKPGVKVKKSIVKYYNKAKNKELNSKYDPNWIKNIGEK